MTAGPARVPLASRPGRLVAVVFAAVVLVALAVAAVPLIAWCAAPDRPGGALGPRGQIVVDGMTVAKSERAGGGPRYQRTYASAAYAHAVGFVGSGPRGTGVEAVEDAFLAGESGEPGRQVVLTLRRDVQEAAQRELADGRRGAVIAIDPQTGAVLAMVSAPGFDPNPLAGADLAAARAQYQVLAEQPTRPLVNRTVSQALPPESTFKVVVAAAALQAGLTADTAVPGGPSYQPPGSSLAVRNAGGAACPETMTLKQAITVSCHTPFARLGVERLGAERIGSAARAFGFGGAPTFDRDDGNAMAVAASETGPMTSSAGTGEGTAGDAVAVAQSCLGQRDVRMTPLQGALIAAAIANGGAQMRPYLVDRLRIGDRTVYQAAPKEMGRPVPPQVASGLDGMLRNVVANGVGRNARVTGVDVGGMAGTGQAGTGQAGTGQAGTGQTGTGQTRAGEHGWFIGYAMRDGKPVVAVGVLLEEAGATAGSAAARAGGAVMRAAATPR